MPHCLKFGEAHGPARGPCTRCCRDCKTARVSLPCPAHAGALALEGGSGGSLGLAAAGQVGLVLADAERPEQR
jgi:hypothetical protein